MLQERAEIGKLAHRTNEFLEVVEASGRVRRALRLPHVDIAALLENELGQLLMRNLLGLSPPAVEVLDEASQDLPGARFELFRFDEGASRARERKAGAPTVVVQDGERRVAKAPLWLVENAL